MSNSINKKTTPNQMRILIKRMRDGNYIPESTINKKKDLNMRDMLKITRKLNEDFNTNKDETVPETVFDQEYEEKRMRDFFNSFMGDGSEDIDAVSIRFIPFDVDNNMIFWGGIIDGIIKFTFTVTLDKANSTSAYDYTEDFSPDDPNNEKIIEGLDIYFEDFREHCLKEYFKQ